MESEQKDKSSLLLRYTPPTRYDLAPYKTIVRVIKDDDRHEHFIQLNEDDSCAHWMKVSTFFEEVFKDSLLDNSFIQECIDAFKLGILKR